MSFHTIFEGTSPKILKKILIGTDDVPVDDADLANKLYVDDTVNSIEHWLRDAGTATVFLRVPGDKVAGGLAPAGSFLIESTLNASKGSLTLLGQGSFLKSVAGGRAGLTTFADVDKLYLEEDTGVINLDGAMIANLPGDEQLIIDADTNPRTSLNPFQINMDSNSNTISAIGVDVADVTNKDDVRGITVFHDVSGSSASTKTVGIVYEFNVDGTTNAHLDCASFSKNGVKDASVYIHGLHVGVDINPVLQDAGTLVAIEKAFKFDDSAGTFTDVTTEFNSDVSNVSMFDDDDDIVYVGKDAKFSMVDFCLNTVAPKSISPVFEYFNGATFTTLGVTDNTSGMQSSGSITFIPPGDWVTNDVNGTVKFWFRITRTRNSLATIPIETLVKYSSTATFQWDKDGNLDVNQVLLSSFIQLDAIAAPANPLDNEGRLFMKTGDDGVFWKPNSAGPEVDLTEAGVWDRTVNDIAPKTAGGILNIDNVVEETLNNGVNIDGSLIKDKRLIPDSAVPASFIDTSSTFLKLNSTSGTFKIGTTGLTIIGTSGIGILSAGSLVLKSDGISGEQVAITNDIGVNKFTYNNATDVIEISTKLGIGTTPNEQLEITENFRLPATTATTGIIKSGTNLYIHNFGTDNFFAGVNSGNLTVTGQGNTGVGLNSLNAVNNGDFNTACGKDALSSVISGQLNTAIGRDALKLNTGSSNTACGNSALGANTTGVSNIGIGITAGAALTTGNNNIDIGNVGVAGEGATIRIGTSGTHTKNFQAGIRGVTTDVVDAIAVLVDSTGQLGTVSSSRVFKKDIHDMADVTNDLMKLRPVVFTYKTDKTGRTQYGLIAEEVLEVYPELVAHSANGKVETVHYRFLSSMLLNEVQKQKKLIDSLESRLSLLEQHS